MGVVKPMLVDMTVFVHPETFIPFYTTIALIGDIIAGIDVSDESAERSKELGIWNTIYTGNVFQTENINPFVSRIYDQTLDRVYFLLAKCFNELQSPYSKKLSYQKRRPFLNCRIFPNGHSNNSVIFPKRIKTTF